jgi:flagellar P-ring protein precursor FlgI
MLSCRHNRTVAAGLLAALALLAPSRAAGATGQVPLRDIVTVDGVRDNPLFGIGLVVGLSGTGSGSAFTRRLAINMLHRMKVSATALNFDSENIAAVMVTATLPPFAAEGGRIDVTVSVLDDGTSLQGGTLLLTPLKAPDGEVYAVAQGSVSVGGFTFAGSAASGQKNHPTVGRIPGGATVERTEPCTWVREGTIGLRLRTPDFATAVEAARVIGEATGAQTAAVDAGTILVPVPRATLEKRDFAGFLGRILALRAAPGAPAKVVINERTGTIVSGEAVTISTVAIAHGSLTVLTREQEQVSQPPPFSRGATTTVNRTDLRIREQEGALQVTPGSATASDVARALNALGATPRDLIAIFQALKRAGALHAELEIM